VARAPAMPVVDAFAALVAKGKALDARAIRKPERFARPESVSGSKLSPCRVVGRLRSMASNSRRIALSPSWARVSSGMASLAAPVLSPAPASDPASSLSTVRLRGVGGFVLRMDLGGGGYERHRCPFHLAQTGTGLHLGFVCGKTSGSVVLGFVWRKRGLVDRLGSSGRNRDWAPLGFVWPQA
jgi:hypothetical protein